MTPKAERFEMRLDTETIEKVDEWRSGQPDVPSRAEAMRRLVDIGLGRPASTARISDGERVLIGMMGDLYKHLKVKGEFDPPFICEALGGGHSWALRWEYSGLVNDEEEDTPEQRRAVLDVLDLWYVIEASFNKLSKKDKERVTKEHGDVGFPGFDGNHETVYMSIAYFLIERLGRYQEFKDRDLNSHTSHMPVYDRMLRVYAPMKKNLMGRLLSADEISELLSAMKHPSNG
jgi:uncharacterized protein YfbU (UPF0304 family)